MTALYALALFFIAAAICHVIEHKSSILQSLGFGFVVYHSDSQKYFWAKNYNEAIEWQRCALGDSCVFDNFTKEVVAIRLAA